MGVIMHDDVPYGGRVPTTDPEVLVRDTVGWTGKNLLEITNNGQTISDVVFTTNADRSVSTSGSRSVSGVSQFKMGTLTDVKVGDSLILSGCPSGGGESTFNLCAICKNSGGTATKYSRDKGSGVTFEIPANTAYIDLYIEAYYQQDMNNLTFYPMIRKASVLDPTYEPYHESVEEVVKDIRSEQAVLGAKNWFNPYAIHAGQEYVTISESGKTIRVANSTAGSYKMGQWKFPVNPNTVYRVTGSATVTSGICNVSVYDSENTSEIAASGVSSTSKDIDFTFNSGNNTQIYFKLLGTGGSSEVGDVTYNNMMITLATDPDDTYVPYAMTNRELTELAAVQESAVTDIIEGAVVVNDLGNHLLKCGKVVYLTLSLNRVNIATSWTDVVFMIPEGYRPKYAHQVRTTLPSDLRLQINSNGKVLTDKILTDAGLFLSTSWITP